MQSDVEKTLGEPRPLVAIASVIVSMALVAIGNGLMFSYIPVRLGADGYAPTWAGGILTGLSAGGIAGCLLTGVLVRRIGHARAYMVLSALIVLSNAGVAAGADPVLWIAARALYGFGICAMFIVAQSWLNDAVDNSIRGRVMAVFYVSYIVGMGIGSALMGRLDIGSAQAPLIGIAFTALSMLPVGMTRLAQPPAPEAASVALRLAWRISPVGITGMLAVGGLSMMIAGFAPIHATAKGFTQQEVAMLMFCMPLVLTTVILVVYVVWGGASESIYSLASAHANDRASKDDLVALSSSMLFAWSVSGFLIPGIGTVLTAVYGTQSFIYVAVVIAVAYALFVAWRVAQARPVPSAETGSFAPMTAQAPLPVELGFTPEEPGRP